MVIIRTGRAHDMEIFHLHVNFALQEIELETLQLCVECTN